MTHHTTRAILIDRLGPPEALVEREVPLPDPGPREIHLEVEAAGINFADLMMRAGLYGTVPPRPFSPGFEVAGIVARTGPSVVGWREGDRAVALLRYGGYARDVVLPEGQLFPYPTSLTPVEAAAVPVNFLTAWVCLFETGHARPGDTTLILGAGGGVGTAAVQLAVQRDLRVIGTAGDARKRSFVVEELGAEACFDSRGDWEKDVQAVAGERGIDIALDPVGGPATAACRRQLAPLGRLVFYGLSNALPRRKRSWLRAIRAFVGTRRFHPASLAEPNVGVFGVHLLHLGSKEELLGPALEEIYRGITAAEWRPIVDRVFPMDQSGAAEAHSHIHARGNLGKVLLAP